jgi:hypothetical protein
MVKAMSKTEFTDEEAKREANSLRLEALYE